MRVPDDIHPNHWGTLVDHWNSPKYKEMEKKNAKNRATLKSPNPQMGRKNLNQLESELVEKGIEVDRKELFKYSKSREGVDGPRIWHDEEYKKNELMVHLTTPSSENDSTFVLLHNDAHLQATGKEHPCRLALGE